jgi:uncharacterized protein
MKKIVIDTNVLVSGLLFSGLPGEIVSLWKNGTIRPLCSKEIVDEYLRVLAYPKFKLSESEIDFILTNEILPYFDVINVKPGKSFVTADPEDDKFIWCALAGSAKAIVSGDEHLLKLTNCSVSVLTVAEFLQVK